MTLLSDLDIDELIIELQAISNISLNSIINTRYDKSKFYELYIMNMVKISVEEIRDVTRCEWIHPDNVISMRKGPGYIYNNNHSYIKFTYHNGDVQKEYELHLGIRYIGKTTLHELDISLLPSSIANNCRIDRKNPNHTKLLLGIECKHYETSLGIGLGRQFVGLIDDMNKNKVEALFISNIYGKTLNKYFAPNDRPNYFKNIIPNENENSFIEYVRWKIEDILLRE